MIDGGNNDATMNADFRHDSILRLGVAPSSHIVQTLDWVAVPSPFRHTHQDKDSISCLRHERDRFNDNKRPAVANDNSYAPGGLGAEDNTM